MEIKDGYPVSCHFCKHKDKDSMAICKAFPKGIPIEITSGEKPHIEPLEQQGNKIVFEPVKTIPVLDA